LIAIAACGHPDGRDNDQNQFNAVKPSAAVIIGKETEQELAYDRADEGTEVDNQTMPSSPVRPIHECDRSKNDVGRKEVIALGIATRGEGRRVSKRKF